MNSRNRYVVLDVSHEEVDIFNPRKYGWGRDFYLDVFRHIEVEGKLQGLTVYISYSTPKALPRYGRDVVLVITGDEHYQHYAYFKDVGYVFRSYGQWPVYLDGLPCGRQSVAALKQYFYKMVLCVKMRLVALKGAGLKGLNAGDERTLQVPLGLFQAFDPKVKSISERQINYGFMGSVSDETYRGGLLHRLQNDSKTLSRRRMMDMLETMPDAFKGHTHTTASFQSSVDNHHDYASVMADTKIALVPRGSCYETYRFYEACKAGCVIICEPLPDTWFYRNHPGIVIRDWSEVPQLIARLLASEKEMQTRSQAALSYWKTQVSERATATVVGDFLMSCVSDGQGSKNSKQPQAAVA
ncbi:glycosyltransferase [Asticcacaulis machinosus]|uniref:Glycosyltransferase n=1 Tax=Asticcacaulis machinosus TaxID=2984211 RepID=A0ABT5HNF1_9CAUL|nr:glycosyltransferase [Asticcacaulis machinosus]MDC7677665.1 glycosyltransferase [Asticcacaulis machinosus]